MNVTILTQCYTSTNMLNFACKIYELFQKAKFQYKIQIFLSLVLIIFIFRLCRKICLLFNLHLIVNKNQYEYIMNHHYHVTHCIKIMIWKQLNLLTFWDRYYGYLFIDRWCLLFIDFKKFWFPWRWFVFFPLGLESCHFEFHLNNFMEIWELQI